MERKEKASKGRKTSRENDPLSSFVSFFVPISPLFLFALSVFVSLSVDRMLITARMTLAVQLLSKILSLSLSPIYGAFVAAHFFNDKFNYARRALGLSPFSPGFFEMNITAPGRSSIFFSAVIASSLLPTRGTHSTSIQFNVAEIEFENIIIFDIK